MAKNDLQELVGTAIISSQFRSELITNTARAIEDFNLSPEERLFVSNIRANTFQSFAQQLHDWISDESPVVMHRVPTAIITR